MPRVGFAVLAIDVDELKPVNDEYGHEAGDDIFAPSPHPRGAGPTRDLLARIGGDEFALLVAGSDEAEAKAVGERMQQAMYGTASVGARRASASGSQPGAGRRAPSCGGAPTRPCTAPSALGRDRVEGAAGATARARRIEPGGVGRAARAGSTQQVAAAGYQPIVRLGDSRVVGYEALARLPKGMLDEDVEELFATAKGWASCATSTGSAAAPPSPAPAGAARRGPSLFVNVSSVALLDPVHGVDQMLLLCRWPAVHPRTWCSRSPSARAIPEVGRLRGVLASYREHGFRFALDDVGEGHSHPRGARPPRGRSS